MKQNSDASNSPTERHHRMGDERLAALGELTEALSAFREARELTPAQLLRMRQNEGRDVMSELYDALLVERQLHFEAQQRAYWHSDRAQELRDEVEQLKQATARIARWADAVRDGAG